MLAGFIVIGQAAGTYRLSELLADPPGGTPVTVALLLILLGAFTKSAQVPFHTWLPGAMVAPTPVSTYLHSATMVKAGVYLVARLAPAYALATDWWRPVVVSVGVVTMVVGGAAGPAPHRPQAAARRRHDQPARLHDRRVRLGHDDHDHRRLHDAARPRRLQGDRVHGRRHRRPRARARATSASCPAPAPDGDRRWWRRRSPRRRWPASRCCSASSPRRPTTRASSIRVAAPPSPSPVIVVGSALTVGLQPALPRRGDGRLAEDDRVPRPGGHRPRASFVAPALVLSAVA